MTYEAFDELFDGLIAECRGMRDTKGPEYAGTKDRLANFKQQAEDYGVSPMVVCGIFKKKHEQAIASYARGEYRGSEPIRGRIVDAIVYNVLMLGLIVEAEPKNCSACGGSGSVVQPSKLIDNHLTIGLTCPACKGTGKSRI